MDSKCIKVLHSLTFLYSLTYTSIWRMMKVEKGMPTYNEILPKKWPAHSSYQVSCLLGFLALLSEYLLPYISHSSVTNDCLHWVSQDNFSCWCIAFSKELQVWVVMLFVVL